MQQKSLFVLLASTVLIINSCSLFNTESKTKKIIFVGDLLLDRGVREKINHSNVDILFQHTIDSIFKENDIVVANLECPSTKIEEPINKKFIFRSEPEWLAILKRHGITHLNLANNHSMDQGRKGLIDTKNNILKTGLVPLGFGDNLKQACQAELLATSPRNLYLLSSLQVPSENWTYLENKPCVCEESFNDIVFRIKELKKKDPDCVIIVQLHWGVEHTLVPIISQRQQAHQLINAGADGIIGHHTHTLQTIEFFKEKPIYYSIGNFIFDQSKPINSKGIMVQIELSKSTIHFKTIPFIIDKCSPHLTVNTLRSTY